MERCRDLAPIKLLPSLTDKSKEGPYADVARLGASKFERVSFFKCKLRARRDHCLMEGRIAKPVLETRPGFWLNPQATA